MSASTTISRRALIGGFLLAGCRGHTARAQGFAGLGRDVAGFATVVPGVPLTFPADHGPHPEFRIEWWYLTANLAEASGTAYGAQWTLFRQAMAPGAQLEGWANQQIWMGHAAVTRADTHRASETFGRGGVSQAGAEADPFRAWIDSWEMNARDGFSPDSIGPLDVHASGTDFSYALRLESDRPLVLEGDGGYSKKSERGQASYYYSQPYFRTSGRIVIDDKPVEVTGAGWMDREWSSQPLASDQTGWDWFSLHLGTGEKLMLFRLRQSDGQNFFSGNWIGLDGKSVQMMGAGIEMTPLVTTSIGDRKLPTSWRITILARGLKIETAPLNAKAWMATSFPYWEGPIRFDGSHRGVGYLEMTGY